MGNSFADTYAEVSKEVYFNVYFGTFEAEIMPIDRPGVTKSLLAAKGRTDLGQEGAIIFLPREH